MTLQDIISQVGKKISLNTARKLAQDNGVYDASAEQSLRAAHDAAMEEVCNHQDRMDRVMRRGY